MIEVSDAVIVIFLTLFVASTINERIIDFIKIQFPTLWMKNFNFNDELRRRRRLWLLAFFMGLITSYIIDVNLLEILVSTPDALSDISGMLDNSKEGEYPTFLGLVLTAIFISLGSKFWHDILDLALYVRRAKRKIHNFDPKNIEDIKQVDKYLEENEYDLAKKALETHRKRLTNAYGEEATMVIGYEYIDNQHRVCIQVWDREKSIEKEPEDEPKRNIFKQIGKSIQNEWGHYSGVIKRISYTTDYGYIFKFPVVVYYSGKAVTANNKDENIAKAGGGLFNSSNDENIGTFGCIVKKQEEDCEDIFLLTCYHCVRIKDEHDWKGYDPDVGKGEVCYKRYLKSNEVKVVGNIDLAYRDNRMDIALIKPDSPKDISDYHWTYNKTVPIGSDFVNENNSKDRRKIWFSGLRTGANEGYIINQNFPVKINYGDDTHWLYNLIIFSQTKSKPYKRPCSKGDSGAIIIDAETHQALGMIVAVDEKFGYAIPIKDILRMHGLGLYLDPCIINYNELQNKTVTT